MSATASGAEEDVGAETEPHIIAMIGQHRGARVTAAQRTGAEHSDHRPSLSAAARARERPRPSRRRGGRLKSRRFMSSNCARSRCEKVFEDILAIHSDDVHRTTAL